MAIVQISKIQIRAGNLVDLPQLDNAEFGWATDTNQLFIGRTGNNYSDENIEVLTSYSTSGSIAGGANTTVQFNDQGTSNGVAGFTFNKSTTTLTVSSGNIITGNLNATSTITALD